MSLVRNIGIIAHIDAGKTTTTERFLFYAGKEHRMGEVHEGTARMDWREEEQERGITITSAATMFKWGKATINLIDTPGHVDFTAEVERSLRVLDGAVGVFCGVAGVQPQSETVWRQADRYNVPRIIFVNKLDRVGADYHAALSDIENKLSCTVLAMVLPLGQESEFSQVIDLVNMKQLAFSEESLGATVEVTDIEEQYQDDAELYRSELIEKVAESSDEVMALFLEGEEVPIDLLKAAIRKGTLERTWIPAFGGSAFKNKGVQLLLDSVVDYLPSPEDQETVTGVDPKKPEKDIVLKREEKEKLAALLFKVQVDQHGELCFLRIYSGKLAKGMSCLNPRIGKKERIGNLFVMHANSRQAIHPAKAGDIVAVTGLRFSGTGDTLCDQKAPVQLGQVNFPEAVISMAIEPRTSAERDKLLATLERLTREDPTLSMDAQSDSGQIIVSGMGELHLEVMRNRLVREFKVDAKIGKPRVSYRQTFLDPQKSEAKVERQIGGKDQSGEIAIQVTPDDSNASVTLEWGEKGGLSAEWMKRVEESLLSTAEAGGSLPFPFAQIKITCSVLNFSEETTELGLVMAAKEAFDELADGPNATVLEPVMRFQIATPEEYYGAINQDMNKRRGQVDEVDMSQKLHRMTGVVPLAEVFGYTTDIRSLSQGRADMSLEPTGYAPAPSSIGDKFRF